MLKRCFVVIPVLLALTPVTASAGAAQITEFSLPQAGSQPIDITTGPDGALWFTEQGRNAIGRITTAGGITEFAVPTPSSNVDAITAGPDGALWFTETVGNKIGRITTGGSITEFALPSAFRFPTGITAGPDGALWFTEPGGPRIGRITTSGTITEFTVTAQCCAPDDITAGPDGALWFTYEGTTNAVGRITTTGSVGLFPLPSANTQPGSITAGRDGALWFTETGPFNGGAIGRVTTTGSFSEFRIPTAAHGITAGPHRPVWFTASSDQVGRVTVGGRVGEFRVPTADSSPEGITTGPDGALWFTESSGDKIGRITPGPAPSEAFVEGKIHVEPPCPPDQNGLPTCPEQPRYIFDATSQPINANPRGTVQYQTGERFGETTQTGPVTCLFTRGNRATVGVNFGPSQPLPGEPPRAAVIFVVDNGSETADMIAVENLPAGSAPSTCPATPPPGVSFGPGFAPHFGEPGGPGISITYLPSGP